jgi:hypothetical protein
LKAGHLRKARAWKMFSPTEKSVEKAFQNLRTTKAREKRL